MNESKKIAIIGAGISGLTAAWRLKNLGYDVTLLEKEKRTGGVIHSEVKEGFICEYAANEMQLKSYEMEQVLYDIGLKEEIIDSNKKASKRFIGKNRKVYEAPCGPISFITTGLFSLKGKLRLFWEPFAKRFTGEDESVADFAKRRFGQDFLDYAIGPLVSGVCSGDPAKVSFRHQFPRLWVIEDKFGSLTGGMFKRAKEMKRKGEKRYSYRLVTFKNGMETLPKKLTAKVKNCIHLNATVTEIQKDPWVVKWTSDRGSFEASFDAVVLATPAHAYPSLPLPDSLTETKKELSRIEYPPLCTYFMGFEKSQIKHKLDGFGFLVSQKDKASILGTIFNSTLFESTTPNSKANLVTFMGGSIRPDLATISNENARKLALEELDTYLGVTGEPIFEHRNVWEKALPQYHVGHQFFLDIINEAEKRNRGLYIIGNFRGGSGCGDVVLNASNIGYKIHDELSN
jgi:oxygen-dependent protoporphyrinogen oxidase